MKEKVIDLGNYADGRYRIADTDIVIKKENGKISVENEDKESEVSPKAGDLYFCISASGCVYREIYDDNPIYDELTCAIGNCFKTEEEAKFAVERLKVLAEMRKFAEPKDRTWNFDNRHWGIHYNYTCDEYSIVQYVDIRDSGIYFESEEKAYECIETIGIGRIKKYYFGIGDD